MTSHPMKILPVTLFGFFVFQSVSVAFAQIASPPPAVMEGFTSYTSPLNRQGDDHSGWQGGWAGSPKWGGVDEVNSGAVIADGNLEAPTGYVFTPSSTKEGLSRHVENFETGMVRVLRQRIDLSKDAVTYFSFLWSQSGSGEFGTLQISLLADQTHSRKPFMLTTRSSQLSLVVENGGRNAGRIPFKPESDYLLVGKLVSAADPEKEDQIFVHIWESGTQELTGEPVDWHLRALIGAQDRSAVLGRFFALGSPGNLQKLDEIRIGPRFVSVTGRN